MLKFLGFSIFDVGVFLRFEMFKMLKIAFSIFSTFDEMLVLKKKKRGIEAIIRKILIYLFFFLLNKSSYIKFIKCLYKIKLSNSND